MNWGIFVDLGALVAVVVLAVYGRLPESVVSAVITMVIVGRFKPPEPIILKKTIPPPPPTDSSGIIACMVGFAHVLRSFGK